MPRDGSGIYSTPPGTDGGPPGVTIASTPYNVNVHDVEADLNAARPIIAGGTGATNVTEARDNLNAEVAGQTVTNYDSHVWETGSFWSQVGATAAPTADHVYTGHCVLSNNDQNWITLHATDITNGTTYVRTKVAGVWGAWELAGADEFINTAGDTMTGALIINSVPAIVLDKNDSSIANTILGTFNANPRWSILLGGGTPLETGGNTGSNFEIIRASDAGSGIDVPLKIMRSSGATILSGQLTMDGGFKSFDSPSNIKLRWGVSASIERNVDGSGWFPLFDTSNSPRSANYVKFANGAIFQYGTYSGTSDGAVTFPTVFPNACLAVQVTADSAGLPATGAVIGHADSLSTTGFTARKRFANNGGAVGLATQAVYWTAVGW